MATIVWLRLYTFFLSNPNIQILLKQLSELVIVV